MGPNLKNFFKPTVFKILLAILLFVLPWITAGVYAINSSPSLNGGIVQENIWRTGFYYFGKILFLPVNLIDASFVPLYFILLALYCYALASVIAFLLPKGKPGSA